MNKPFAESCVQNQAVILEQLARLFAARRRVLEIGSGTGQHAVHFGRHLPHLQWQTSELPEQHAGIRLWLEEAALPNVLPPLALDVAQGAWPAGPYDAAFSANTAHIMGWPQVVAMFHGVAAALASGGLFALYGPFHYHGRPTAESNARFDAWLRARDPASGVRDFADLDALARDAGLRLAEDIAMPVNNRLLVWRRAAVAG
jgi:predicted O-methyltransferase YrrM